MNIKKIFNFSSKFENRDEIILRDYSLYLLLGGIAIIQLEGFESIKFIGYISLGLTILLVIIGIYRFQKLNRQLKNYYSQIELMFEEKKES